MKLPSLITLSAVLLASEIALALTRRSKARASGQDQLTLPLLWVVIAGSVSAGFFLRVAFPQAALPSPRAFYLAGFFLFVAGLIVRWSAILHLGRFFTVNVAIADDHQLITTGPYRYVRHPSYTGTLLIFLGFGLCLLNFLSLLVLVVPITAAFLWRIHVEEAALRDAFGEGYRDYAARTRRIIPLLY